MNGRLSLGTTAICVIIIITDTRAAHAGHGHACWGWASWNDAWSIVSLCGGTEV